MSKNFAFAAALLLFVSPIVHADEKYSDAEVLLFETNHLKEITKPTILQYEYKKDGALEKGFDDKVSVNISKVGSEGKTVSADYLSGERKTDFPAVDGASGNPVVMYFLERDIREMQRLTGGKPPYFKKRIRLSLADGAEVRPVKFSFDGKEVEGREIKITPYANDPLKARFGKYVGKYYLFTLAEGIPGGVYQMRAIIPEQAAQTDAKSTPMIQETLTFSKASNLADGK